MNKNLNIANQIAFRLECKIVNMTAEYGPDHLGDAEWMIFTDLSAEELASRYAEELKEYSPYICMTMEMYTPVLKFNNNERDQRRREEKRHDYFSYEDGDMERFHPELAYNQILCDEFDDLYSAIDSLPVIQRRRVVKKYFDGMTCKEIGDSEGASEAAVSTSLKIAIENLKKIMAEA